MCAAASNEHNADCSSQRKEETGEISGPNNLVIFDRNSRTIQRFKPENDEWHTTENGFTEDMGTWSFTSAVFGTAMLIFMNNKAVYRFQRTSKGVKWHRLPDMKFNHGQRPPVVVLNGTFFAIGSAGLGIPTDSGERYSVARKEWIPIKNMLSARRNHALVSSEDSIYSIVGSGKSGTLSTVERYDPVSKSWSQVTTLKRPRHSAAAVATGDNIFIMGGLASGQRMNDFLHLSMPSGICISLQHMHMTRSSFTACIIDGKIFAVGGDNSRHDTVEVYDAEKDEWDFMDILSTLEIDAAVSMSL